MYYIMTLIAKSKTWHVKAKCLPDMWLTYSTDISIFSLLPLSTIQRRLENIPDRWFMDSFNFLLYPNILFQGLVSLCRILNNLYSNYTAEDSLHYICLSCTLFTLVILEFYTQRTNYAFNFQTVDSHIFVVCLL